MAKDVHTLHFGPFLNARFLERPNRFLVRCDIEGAGIHDAFLPNPGRLWELLFPGVRLYVTLSDVPGSERNPSSSSDRRTKYTVMAVERDGRPIFLHTHLNNAVARFLIEQRRVPELGDAEIVQAEYTVGKSRFDFLLQDGRRKIYLEVKSCTLFGNNVAMFPDAVTARGRRHLTELASLRSRTIRPCVLFVIHTPEVRWFMPDYHTDLEFSRTLLDVRKKVDIFPVAVEWSADLLLGQEVKQIDIPWKHLRREVEDRGSYLLVLKLDKPAQIDVGCLGSIAFRPGFYLYTGSAMKNLQSRVARHARLRKTMHWHIDYLRNAASGPVVSLPIRSSLRQECDVARAFAEIFEAGPTGFGSSDCRCPTHLLWHPEDPLQVPAFHAVLQQFRMRHPAHEGPVPRSPEGDQTAFTKGNSS